MLYNIIYTIINSTHTVSCPRAPTNKVVLQIKVSTKNKIDILLSPNLNR